MSVNERDQDLSAYTSDSESDVSQIVPDPDITAKSIFNHAAKHRIKSEDSRSKEQYW